MGSSRGKDEHAVRVAAHLQQAALAKGCFACRSRGTGPTGDWVWVWCDLTLLLGTPIEAESGLVRGMWGEADFQTETHVRRGIVLRSNHS